MKVYWDQPTTYVDGSPFGQADFAGWTIGIDDQPAVSVPVGWNSNGDGKGMFDLEDLDLSPAPHRVVMYTVAKNGLTSDPSAPVMTPDKRAPKPPLALSVA